MARMAASMEHDEDADKLKLGPDFNNANTLLNAEVALILEHKLNASQANGVQPKSIFLKSYEYVNRVKRFKNKEGVTQVRQDLERHALQEFEVAQLGNLLPDSADEAKALIPSLVEASITNEQLSEAPEQLRGYRSYAS